jgi:hypothetical protein
MSPPDDPQANAKTVARTNAVTLIMSANMHGPYLREKMPKFVAQMGTSDPAAGVVMTLV